MTTVYATDSRFADHEFTGYSHPEHPGRVQAVWELLEATKIVNDLHHLQPTPVATDILRLAHSDELIDQLAQISRQDRLVLIDHDTYALPESYEIARLAVGATVQATEAVLNQQAKNGLVVVRPPGHHATINRAMGFCLLNSIAVAARVAQRIHQVERILIVDFDVHHGNGTQDIFYNDPGVYFISTHQSPFYPGTGYIDQTGIGAGDGYTLNIPMPGGQGDENYAAVFDEIIYPAAKRYQPELILVSAGFDAHWVDPLANMKLSLTGFAQLTRKLVRMAEAFCGGKIIVVMEGGYDLQALSHGILNVSYALLGQDEVSDPYGPAKGQEPDISKLIEQIKGIHDLT
ncbi:MAG: histone deacetylase [Anaerolineae bacterium]|nr:histone deacetylase [Anaerolineae bacterium]